MANKLFDALYSSLKGNRDSIFFTIKRSLRRSKWTGNDVLRDIRRARGFLEKNHLKPGDKILIWAPSMPEWATLFLGCIGSGIVVVPIDYRSNWQTVEEYIKKTKPKLGVASSFLMPLCKNKKLRFFELESINTSEQVNRKPVANKDNLVEIVFTSGSSSKPKGVLITYDNIMAQMEQIEYVIPPLKRFETVSILPLSHIYEQMYGLFMPILKAGKVNYLYRTNPFTIKKELKRSRSTYLLGVPQILRMFYNEILRKVPAEKKPTLQRLLKLSSKLPFFARKIIFKKVHESFGGQMEFMTSGSAPLEPKLAKVWEAMGFKILEGYGASETNGMITCLDWRKRIFGTVGKPSMNAEVKLGDDNEVLAKGRVVSPGYFENKAADEKNYKEGWYHTGDTGEFKDGNLIITGRISSRIIMPDGTKVYPEDIERTLNDHAEIKDSCIVEKKQGSDIIIHAFIIPQKKEIDAEKVIREINAKLESKQQIFSFETWKHKDFPRLRTLKVDRKKIQASVSGGKEIEPENLDLTSIENILRNLSGKQKIDDSQALGDDLKLDSLKRILLASMIEEETGIPIYEASLTPQTTVKEIKKIVKKQEQLANTHSVESILSHWRFRKHIKVLRYFFQKLFIFPLHGVFVKLKIEKGAEHLKKMGQTLVVINHPGMFDAVCPMRLLPDRIRNKTALAVTNERWDDGNKPVAFLIDMGMCGFPFAKEGPWVVAGMEATGELADAGYTIMIAPEGSMQRSRKLQEFKPGIGLLAKQLNLPILMIKTCSEEYWKIFPPPPVGVYGTTKEYYRPRGVGTVHVRIGYANIDESLNDRDLAIDIREQFKRL